MHRVNVVNAHLLAPRHGSLKHGYNAREAGIGAPVDHLARVGPHFIIAGAHGRVEHKRALGAPCGVNGQGLLFHHLARSIEQFDIEHAREGLGPQRGRLHHVGAIPEGFALVVTIVVQMQIHLLARCTLYKACRLPQTGKQHRSLVRRLGEEGDGQEEKEKKEEEGSHRKEIHRGGFDAALGCWFNG